MQNVTKKEADHKFGIFDPAATVDYDSFQGCSCRCLSGANPFDVCRR
jgi:hypothetical protein